jgi:type I restriction enzyme M protein
MAEIEKNDYNLNISRYVSTAEAEEAIDLAAVQQRLSEIDQRMAKAAAEHNQYLKELGLPSV